MSTSQTTTKISTDDLREEVRKEYAEVAVDPPKGRMENPRDYSGDYHHRLDLINFLEMAVSGY